MTVLKMGFNGNPNVGLFGCSIHGHCLLGEKLQKDVEERIAGALKERITHLTIAGTPMPSVFIAANTHAVLVPGIAFDQEVVKLEKLKLPVQRFETKLTCLGNNIVVNNHGCLVSQEFSDTEIKRLEEAFKVPVKRIRIAGLDTPGACVVLNGKRGIIHRDAEEFEIDMVKQTLKLESLEPASVNLGSPYVKAGIIANKEGFIVGDRSGGPEIVHIEESLGYLEEGK